MNQQKIQYIDVLRVLSMLSVIFLHTAAGSLRANIGSPVWHFSNIFTSVMSTSVPVFFMISGAMLLSSEKTESIRYTLGKRLPKAFIPFLTWSLIAVAYYAAMSFKISGSIDTDSAIRRLTHILNEPTTIHLWFMYALLPIYLLSPILKKLVNSLTNDHVKYLFIIWIVFSSILPTLSSFMPQQYKGLFSLNSSFNLNYISGYLGYFLAGYYIFIFNKKIPRKLLSAIIAIDTVLIIVGTWCITNASGVYSEAFKGYTRVFMVVLSVAVFLFVKELLSDRCLPKPLWKIVQFLSAASFGIYLLHNLVVDFISHFIHLYPAASVYTLFGAYLIVFIISLACIFILSSIKITCYAFTGLTYNNACKSFNVRFLLSKRI